MKVRMKSSKNEYYKFGNSLRLNIPEIVFCCEGSIPFTRSIGLPRFSELCSKSAVNS